MSDKEFGSSTRQEKLILEQAAQRSHRSVEKELSEQLKKLRGIFKDVTSVYVSGHPPAGDGEYLHISYYIGDDSSLIRAARTFMYLLPGLFIEGQFCFESTELRKEIYAFCDCLRNCSDPEDPDLLDQFELILEKFLAYFKKVRKALENGDSVDCNDYSFQVTGFITNLIRLLSFDICKAFIRRESEIRRKPGRSYRCLPRSNHDDGFTDKDRAMLKDQNATTNAILYITSGHEFGTDPKAGSLATQVRRKMAEQGLKILLNSPENSVSCQSAADQVIALWTGKFGAYTDSDPDREALRQAVQRLYNAFKQRDRQPSAA